MPHLTSDGLQFQSQGKKEILGLIYLKVTPNSHVLHNIGGCGMCLHLPAFTAGQIKCFILAIFLILPSTIASCYCREKLLLQAITAKGLHKLSLVNYC